MIGIGGYRWSLRGTKVRQPMQLSVAAMDNCIGCRTCMMVCPDFAIEVSER